VLKRTYSRFVSDLTRTSYNHIDKLDFLADYPRARLEAFQPNIIQNSFAAAGIVPVNAERVLSKLTISLRTPSPPLSRPSSRSSEFTLETPRTVAQLQKQAKMMKDLIDRRSKSPPSPLKLVVDYDDSNPLDLDRVCRVCRLLWPCMKQAGVFLSGPGLVPFLCASEPYRPCSVPFCFFFS
jgi:hypothetical protein